tara:strand:+ start:624 stop:797 length:174 start_codon:yes stop_codon:yes gene_type:complete
MTKKLIINCEETTSQSPYAYAPETVCESSLYSFKDTLGGGDTDPIITESGEYFTVSD